MRLWIDIFFLIFLSLGVIWEFKMGAEYNKKQQEQFKELLKCAREEFTRHGKRKIEEGEVKANGQTDKIK